MEVRLAEPQTNADTRGTHPCRPPHLSRPLCGRSRVWLKLRVRCSTNSSLSVRRTTSASSSSASASRCEGLQKGEGQRKQLPPMPLVFCERRGRGEQQSATAA